MRDVKTAFSPFIASPFPLGSLDGLKGRTSAKVVMRKTSATVTTTAKARISESPKKRQMPSWSVIALMRFFRAPYKQGAVVVLVTISCRLISLDMNSTKAPTR